jgi:serine/threonine protein kinase
MEPYIPGISLHYLGSPLVRHTTTTFICTKIAEIKQTDRSEVTWAPIIYQAADVLSRMLCSEPSNRITAAEMLLHPFLNADLNFYEGFEFETFSKRLLLRPCSAFKKSRDITIIYRG